MTFCKNSPKSQRFLPLGAVLAAAAAATAAALLPPGLPGLANASSTCKNWFKQMGIELFFLLFSYKKKTQLILRKLLSPLSKSLFHALSVSQLDSVNPLPHTYNAIYTRRQLYNIDSHARGSDKMIMVSSQAAPISTGGTSLLAAFPARASPSPVIWSFCGSRNNPR